jgi:hypothetical protein
LERVVVRRFAAVTDRRYTRRRDFLVDQPSPRLRLGKKAGNFPAIPAFPAFDRLWGKFFYARNLTASAFAGPTAGRKLARITKK